MAASLLHLLLLLLQSTLHASEILGGLTTPLIYRDRATV